MAKAGPLVVAWLLRSLKLRRLRLVCSGGVAARVFREEGEIKLPISVSQTHKTQKNRGS